MPKTNEYNDHPEPRKEFKVLTVNDMLEELKTAKKNGHGNKKILLSNDDEGNGYHLCFYGITPTKEAIGFAHLPCSVTREKALKEYIVLG